MVNWEQIREKWLKKDHLLILVLVGVLLLVISIPVGEKKEKNTGSSVGKGITEIVGVNTGQNREASATIGSNATPGTTGTTDISMSYEREMEQRLLALLSGMQGVGEAKVMITLRASEEILLDKEEESSRSETSEADSAGGSREVLQRDSKESTVLITSGGENVPVRVKTIYPEIEGVVVAAQGAGTGDVSKQISEMVQVLFGIEAHRVKIVRLE